MEILEYSIFINFDSVAEYHITAYTCMYQSFISNYILVRYVYTNNIWANVLDTDLQ
jgi:hypothetical protein